MSTSEPATPTLSSPTWEAAQWSDFTTVAQELAQASSAPFPSGDGEGSPPFANITSIAERATPPLSSSLTCESSINSGTRSVQPTNGGGEPSSSLISDPTAPEHEDNALPSATPCDHEHPVSTITVVHTPVHWPSSSPFLSDAELGEAFAGRTEASTTPTLSSSQERDSDSSAATMQTPVGWQSSPSPGRRTLSPSSLTKAMELMQPLSPCSSPKSKTAQSSPFDMSPPDTFRRKPSVFTVSKPEAIAYLLTPPDTPSKLDETSPVLSTIPYNPDEPSTWPLLHLPFHKTPGSSAPTHIDEMLTHVHYKGAGANILRELLSKAMEEMEAEEGFTKKNDKKTKEERRGAELIAFFCWPFNVTSEGVWKVGSGISDEELRAWKELGEEVRCAGFHVR